MHYLVFIILSISNLNSIKDNMKYLKNVFNTDVELKIHWLNKIDHTMIFE